MKFLNVFFLALTLGLLAAQARSDTKPEKAAPATDEPMRFAIVRSAQQGCEPKCAEWISAEGKIVPETLGQFQQILKVIGKRKLPLLINSGGGSVEAAIAMGHLIRNRQMDVAVSKTLFKCETDKEPCRPDGTSRTWHGEPHSRSAFCASACTFILASGLHRFVGPTAFVGVHQVLTKQKLVRTLRTYKVTTFTSPTYVVRTEKELLRESRTTRLQTLDKPSPGTIRMIRTFLKEMGISEEVMALMEATPPQDLHWLTRAELSTTHLMTYPHGSEILVALSAEPNAAALIEALKAEPHAMLWADYPTAGPLIWITSKAGSEPGSSSGFWGQARINVMALKATIGFTKAKDPSPPEAGLYLLVSVVSESGGPLDGVKIAGIPSIRGGGHSGPLPAVAPSKNIFRLKIAASDMDTVISALRTGTQVDIPLTSREGQGLTLSLDLGPLALVALNEAVGTWGGAGERAAGN